MTVTANARAPRRLARAAAPLARSGAHQQGGEPEREPGFAPTRAQRPAQSRPPVPDPAVADQQEGNRVGGDDAVSTATGVPG